MKKFMNFKMVLFVAVFGLLLLGPTQVAHADGGLAVKYGKNITVMKNKVRPYNVYYGTKIAKSMENADRLIVKSSKKSVVKPVVYEGFKYVLFETKKTGSATLTVKLVKDGKVTKTYKSKIKVVKYSNPFASIKLGSRDLTSKFKKERCTWKGITTSTKKRSEKIVYKMNKNWKVTAVYYNGKTIRNKGKINYNETSSVQEESSRNIMLMLYNTKTKQYMDYHVTVNLK